MKRHIWTRAQIAYLRRAYPLDGVADCRERLNARFGLSLTDAQVRSATKNHKIRSGRTGRFVKGVSRPAPPNAGKHPNTRATQFRKGQRPAAYAPIGTYSQTTERMQYCPRNGTEYFRAAYWKVKVADTPRTRDGWVFLHRMLCEEAHGPIPKGYAVVIVDGDTENMVPENLACIPRGALGLLNRRYGFSQAPAEHRKTLVAMAQLKIAIGAKVTVDITAPDGVSGHLRDHCERYGRSYGTVWSRVRKLGWTIAEALETPEGEKPARPKVEP